MFGKLQKKIGGWGGETLFPEKSVSLKLAFKIILFKKNCRNRVVEAEITQICY